MTPRVLRMFFGSSVIVAMIGLNRLPAGDWPTYQHDNARSGQTDEALPPALKESWVYRAAQTPLQAWPATAKWDGWNKVYGLKDRMVFDKAFQVAAEGGLLYFGSSIDDKVYCLDAATGAVRWSFFTEGPVRLAPALSGGRLYVGSDDGLVYCLNAATGKLEWKYRPGPEDRRVPGNGRIVSLWAIRSGVVIVDGTAYTCAGVFPSENVFLCAMDAASGRELWKTSMNDFPAQGYMLASATRLYVTTGRSQPLVFERATGKRMYQVEGGSEGGTYALLTGDMLMFGPGKTGQMALFGADQKDHLASFEGNHMIVRGSTSYLHTDRDLSSLDRREYVRLYAERRKRVERKKEISKTLKQLATAEQGKPAKDKHATGADAKRLQAEANRLATEIDDHTRRMQACLKWKVNCEQPLSLILANETLVAGGKGQIVAYKVKDGSQIWQAPVTGGAYGLAVANGRLFVSTDEGTIHCFAASAEGKDNTPGDAVSSSAKRLSTQKKLLGDSSNLSPTKPDPKIVADSKPHGGALSDSVHGPFLEFVGARAVRIDWDTLEPMTCSIEFDRKNSEKPRRIELSGPTTKHSVVVPDVERDELYLLRILGRNGQGQQISTATYEFDSSFNDLPMHIPEHRSPFPPDEQNRRYESLAKKMIESTGTTRGYALVLGAGDGRLAYHLARNSDFQVVILESDGKKAEEIRRVLDRTGMYGSRICMHVGRSNELPYGPYFANLIASEEMLAGGSLPASAGELYRVLRPAGGVIYLGQFADKDRSKLTSASMNKWIENPDARQGESRFDESDGAFWIHRRGKLKGSGEWTHQYALPDNSACSHDDLVRGDLSVLWWGKPGPRPMPDRGPRNPAPVSANGRLYIQGNRTLFGLDAYNGTILWSKQIPTMRRANIPRDGSNMVATDDHLYVAIGAYCVGFDGQTGERKLNIPAPDASPARAKDQPSNNWSYLACVDGALIGSVCKRGSQYLGDDGEWFEEGEPAEISRVTSDMLFSVDRLSGKENWRYHGGVIMNSTITIADGLAYFVESRNPKALSSSTNLLLEPVQKDQHLMAVDIATGKVRWEKPYDFSKCEFMTYMSHTGNTLVVLGTDKQKVYHLYAFDSRTGYPIWEKDAAAEKKHHSGHLAHPALIGSRLYVNKYTYELETGNVLTVDKFDWHGCGVMSASQHSIFHRFEFHGMLDLETNVRTEFQGIRTGCWLSMIPSGGVVLAPETSAGCSCSHAIQTSIAYVPRSAAVRKIAPQSKQ